VTDIPDSKFDRLTGGQTDKMTEIALSYASLTT